MNAEVNQLLNSPVNNQIITATNYEHCKSGSALTFCSNCNKFVTSLVLQDFNWSNYCVFYCFGGIWLFYQSFRNKDINCYNAEHHCPTCTKVITNYNAC